MQEFTVQLFDDGSAQISGTGANLELRFGYSKNAHMYSVKFIRSKEWEDLYIRVHFHPEADIYDVEPVLAQNNIVNIPAMVTSMPGEGKLTIEGTDGYKIITSADIPYRVSENSGIDSESDPEPGESSFQQFVDEVKKDAEEAKQAAKDAESALTETKEASASALTDIEKAKGNAISEIEKIESEVKGEIQEDVNSAKSSAEAASKSAEEAKTAADSAKKSLSDLETAKQSAISEISKEKDNSVSAVGGAKEAALNEISTSGNSAIQNVKTAETNAINSVETEGSTQKTALNNASNVALTSIDTAKTNAVKSVEDKASEESSAIDQKSNEVIQNIQNAGDSELSAISEATSSAIEQITQSAGQHLTQIDSAADEAVTDILNAKEDSLEEIEGVNAHPPIQNPETGKWQIWNAETSSYVDTVYDWEGGYYSPSVDSEGNLTWEGSKEGMEDIPSTNIRGPQGLGVPTPTANDYGKAPTVNASGTGYELTGPYAPLSAAIIETAKGNPAVCEDSVEWPLLGLKVYSKSTQDGTPSPENPVPIVSAGDEGSIGLTLTGKNLISESELLDENNPNYDKSRQGEGYWVLKKFVGFEACTLSVETTTREPNYLAFNNLSSIAGAGWISHPSVNVKSEVTKTPDENGYVYIIVSNDISKIQLVLEAVGYIQLEIGSSATTYEPPKSSQPLTIPTPNGLPGIPVNFGGNFVDADGQEWICNYRDWARGVDVQNIANISYDSQDKEYVSLYWNSHREEQLAYGCVCFSAFVNRGFAIESTSILKCTHFTANGNVASGVPGNEGCMATANRLYFRILLSTIGASAEDDDPTLLQAIRDWLDVQLANGTPVSAIVKISSPIETPIPADELAAYRALHTYDGTTVITSQDVLAEVEVDYLVKPKAYIEKKLMAIESRLNALEISEALEGE